MSKEPGVKILAEDVSPSGEPRIIRRQDHQDSYANNIRASMTPWDMSLHFGRIMEMDENAHIEETTTIRLSPTTMKALAAIIPGMVQQWERRFGKIPTSPGMTNDPDAVSKAISDATKKP